MSKTKKKKYEKPLTRWSYFIKTLYHDAAATTEFTFEKKIYVKSEELQNIEADNKRINTLLLLALFAMFYAGSQFQKIWIFLLYFVLVIVGQGLRLLHLPKDIRAHLTDTGRRQR
ncbi:MAG: hypothetical protein IKV99_04445 [Oscillospiraceae bacterium]|nr:hypothetical protein [Oscillospiraceae bacterium]